MPGQLLEGGNVLGIKTLPNKTPKLTCVNLDRLNRWGVDAVGYRATMKETPKGPW